MSIPEITGLNLIGGRWAPPRRAGSFALENPARPTETVGVAAESQPEDVADAVAAAVTAGPAWAATPAPARGEILYKAAAILEQRQELLAQLTAAEVGKPIGEARAEAQRGVAILRYFAGEGSRSLGDVIPSASPRSLLLFTEREPLGVVGVITPWNFPIAIPLWKVAPALVFGNTVVLKPAKRSSLVARAVVEILAAAGLPDGVLNLVTGSGSDIGAALVTDPAVAAITFTGSTAVGLTIAGECATRNKKHQLEMGGKNAQLVLADADLNLAARAALVGAMGYAGQKCTACSRVIVERSVADAFVSRLRDLAPTFMPKDPSEPTAVMGPVISDSQRRWVLARVETAVQEGARWLYGQEPVELNGGYYLPPIILENVRANQAIAREELFAPVLGVIVAEDAADAIRIANGVPYGLSASVFTRSLDRAFQAARALQAGMIRVNSETTGVEPQAPFGGEKLSSSHSREQGRAAMEFFTQGKTITLQQGE